jgi:UPF0755 protein
MMKIVLDFLKINFKKLRYKLDQWKAWLQQWAHSLPRRMKIFMIGFGLLTLMSFMPPFFWMGTTQEISIYSNTTAREIAKRLQKHGVIDFQDLFLGLLKLTHFGRKLRSGLYHLSPRMSLWRILDILVDGRSQLLSLKIPEGYDAHQIAQELQQLKIMPAKKFLKVVHDSKFIHQLGIHGPSLEGFLFPQTYRVSLTATAPEIARLLVHEFFRQVGPRFKLECHQQGLSTYQGVILASIVEKETRLTIDKPIIAGILYNRLHRHMPLQVNSTLNYALRIKGVWLTDQQLKIPSPYNTYLHYGLPPTPICNPGIHSLRAVLHPAHTSYLYYVSGGPHDDENLFATTFKQHEENIFKLRESMRRKGN